MKTAVELLVEKMENLYYVNFETSFLEEIKQAKEMEKQQIIDAYKFGLSDEYVIGAEQYYNKTFKQ